MGLPPTALALRQCLALLLPAPALLAQAPPGAVEVVWGSSTLPLQAPAEAAVFSQDGARILAVDELGGARIFESSTLRLLHDLKAQDAATTGGGEKLPSAGQFAPDGKRAATISRDGTVRLWDAETGAARAVLRGVAGRGEWVRFSEDGQRLAAGGLNEARIWSASTGEALANLRLEDANVLCATFGAGGRLIVICGDGKARTWDGVSFREHAGKLWDSDPPVLARPSRAGDRAAVVLQRPWSLGRPLRIVDTTSGVELHALGDDQLDIACVAFSADGARIACGSSDPRIQVWSTATGALELTLHAGGPALGIDFSADGKRLAAACWDVGGVWDARTGACLGVFRGTETPLTGIAIDTAGSRILTTGRTVRLWDGSRTSRVALAKRYPNDRWVRWAPDGAAALYVAAAADGIRVRDPRSDRYLATIGAAESLLAALSPDGRRAVLLDREQTTAHVVRIDATGHRSQLQAYTLALGEMDFSPDSRWIAAGGRDRRLRIWDAENGARVLELAAGGPLQHTFLSVGRSKLLAVEIPRPNRAATLWDALTGTRLGALQLDLTADAISLRPDGELLACASIDPPGAVDIRTTSTGERRLRLLPNESAAVSITAFSPDGLRLLTISSSHDHRATLWDVATGNALTVLTGASAGIQHAGFTPDGRQVWADGEGRSLILWMLDERLTDTPAAPRK